MKRRGGVVARLDSHSDRPTIFNSYWSRTRRRILAGVRSPRKRVAARLRKYAFDVLIAIAAIDLVALAGIGLIFQAVAARNDHQKFPAPGDLVDVGGTNCISIATARKSNDHLGRIG
jgi:hypothetical protein